MFSQKNIAFNVLDRVTIVAALLLFLPFVANIGCQKDGAVFDDASQRAAVEGFSKANFRGDTALAYQMLSVSDQKIIAQPLQQNHSLAKYLGDKPWSLLTIVEATNPYDIKSMSPESSFTHEPSEGELSHVLVERYNGTPQRYTLVWQKGGWKIDLNLGHQNRE